MRTEHITANASSYTVIDDGVFKYPVLTADVLRAGMTRNELQRMSGEQDPELSEQARSLLQRIENGH